MNNKDGSGRKLFHYAGAASLGWFATLPIYIGIEPDLFLAMKPDQFATTLAGWFTPVAAILAGTAVLYQRRELLNAAEQAGGIHVDHLVERLAKGAQRLARTCELCELHKRGEITIRLGDLAGRHLAYEELSLSKEYERLLAELGEGLEVFLAKIEDDWVIDASDDAFADLAADLGALHSISAEVMAALKTFKPGHEALSNVPVPTESVLVAFHDRTGRALTRVEGIRREYSSLGNLS